MRGLVMTAHGGPGVLELRDDLEEPIPGEHDLLIEVHACGLNPVDTKIREGRLGERPLPHVLGFDVSGVVVATGGEVEGWEPGDEVYASPSLALRGANAELVVVDARLCARKPARLDHVRSAALPLVTLTAWEALVDRAQTEAGENVLIHAGAGGVGHIALQIAKMIGSRVLTTASRDESKALCRRYGADVIIDYKENDVLERVMEETDGKGCDVVFDTVGGPNLDLSMDCVAVNGRVVAIAWAETDKVVEKLFAKNASLHFEFMGAPALYGIGREHQADILARMADMADAGKILPHVSRTIRLEDVPAAHEDLQAGHTTGKIVVRMTD